MFNFRFKRAVELKEIYVWNYSQNRDQDQRGIGAYKIYVNTGSGFGARPVVEGRLLPSTRFLNREGNCHGSQKIDLGQVYNDVVGIRIEADALGDESFIGFDEIVFRTLNNAEPLGFLRY